MGSISVTYTMEPMAFRAAQHPFPTWTGKEHTIKIVSQNTLLKASGKVILLNRFVLGEEQEKQINVVHKQTPGPA